jgi:pyruvate kinase
MIRARRARIVATLGPASRDMVLALATAGADVFRVNFSHGTHKDHAETIEAVRHAEAALDRPLAVLADLQGPKLRLGEFKDGRVELHAGQAFRLDLDRTLGDSRRVGAPHPEVFAAIRQGALILLDDGKVRLRVTDHGPDFAETVVEAGEKLSDHKGLNLPGSAIPIPALTDKDRKDLAFALNQGVDWVALSFVQRAADMAELRQLVRGRAAVMAKIEKPAALEVLDEILDLSEAIMVARGDLGVELAPEEVPVVQKELIRAARDRGIPIIVATQMLESMITAPVPTRAEVSDVATAVFEGADAVMLSAESAAGQFPIEAVAMMNRIAEEVEGESVYRSILEAQRAEPEETGADAIAKASHEIADTLNLKVIAAWTSSGSTAFRIARERPNSTVIALTPNRATARRLTLVWGVHAVVTKDASDIDDMASRACKFAVREHFARLGDRIIVVAGVPFGTPGATNMVRIAFVAKEHVEKA